MTTAEVSAFVLGALGGSLITLLLRVPLPRQQPGWRVGQTIKLLIDEQKIAAIVDRKFHEKASRYALDFGDSPSDGRDP